MIVVEGPDGSGKSTLAKTLSARLNIPIAPKVVSEDTEAMVDLKCWVDKNLAGGFQRLIFDRHRLVSEPIYGMALPWRRNTHQDFWGDQMWLNESMQSFRLIQPVVILCLPPHDVVVNNIIDDPKNARVLSSMWAVYRGYQMMAARGEIDMLYDYTASDEISIRALESWILQATMRRTK